jgi:hypothetical protein
MVTMAEPNQSGDDKFNFARRALKGLSSKGDGGAQKPPEPKPEEGSGDGEGDLLSKLVNAMKHGPAGISAIEPEGYGYLEEARIAGRPITRKSNEKKIEALQRVLRRVGHKEVTENGDFDEPTEKALAAFQKEKACKDVLPEWEDDLGAIVGPLTMEAFDKELGLRPRSGAEIPNSFPSDPDEDPAPVLRSQGKKTLLPESGNAFIDGLAMGAVRGWREGGIPASVAIAMAVLESNWGERALAKEYHNIFGLRGKGPAGEVYLRGEDDENGAAETPGGGVAYRKYNNDSESVTEFSKMFGGSSEYKTILSHRDRPDNFAQALVGTYSSSPNYGHTLVRIMKQFDLYRFDRVTLS